MSCYKINEQINHLLSLPEECAKLAESCVGGISRNITGEVKKNIQVCGKGYLWAGWEGSEWGGDTFLPRPVVCPTVSAHFLTHPI